ncbi:MAG: cupin domain-containing protein [Bryobacteraceae bacterium]
MPDTSYDKFVFPPSEAVGYRLPTHSIELVLDRADAETSEAFRVLLEPGQATPPHAHDDTEQVFYVLRGCGSLQIDADRKMPIQAGDLIRIPPGACHSIACTGLEPLEYLSIDCFLSRRPPAEPTWEAHLRAVCAENGWDFNHVRMDKTNSF